MTDGDVFSLLCSSKAEKRLHLTAGVHILPLHSDCELHGPGWIIAGIISQHSDIMIETPRLNITPFNLTAWVPDRSILKHMKSPTWAALKRIENVSLSSMQLYADDDDSPWNLEFQPFHWINISNTIIVVVLVVLFIWILRKYDILASLCKCRHSKPSTTTEPGPSEAIPLQDIPVLSESLDGTHTRPDIPDAWQSIIRNVNPANSQV